MGKVNDVVEFEDLKRLQKNLKQLTEEQRDEFCKQQLKQMAANFITGAVKNTRVGQYPKKSGKVGGTLRRGWTSKTHEEAESGTGKGDSGHEEYAASLPIDQVGDTYEIEVKNPVEYAQYIEYGHRTRSGGWVKGDFMGFRAEESAKRVMPRRLARNLETYLKKKVHK